MRASVASTRSAKTTTGRAFERARDVRERPRARVVRRARISTKNPWWEKGGEENMVECVDTGEFLNLLVRRRARCAVAVEIWARAMTRTPVMGAGGRDWDDWTRAAPRAARRDAEDASENFD